MVFDIYASQVDLEIIRPIIDAIDQAVFIRENFFS